LNKKLKKKNITEEEEELRWMQDQGIESSKEAQNHRQTEKQL